VIEIAPWREQNRASRVVELTEVVPILGCERPDVGVRDHSSVSATKYELTLAELTKGEDAQTLAACVTRHDVLDHGSAVGVA